MRATFLLLAVCVPLAAETKLPPPADFKIDFEKHVQPLLAQKCHSCHGEEVQQSGLRLDKRQNAMRGGDYGPVIIPGKSAESKLIRRLAGGDGGLQMPPTGALSKEEIVILRAWIDQGADFRIEVQNEAPRKPVDPKVAAIVSAVRSGDTRAVAKLVAADPAMLKAGDLMGNSQPEVSRLFKGNFREYSIDRLMNFLTVFDRDVEIVTKPHPKSRRRGHITFKPAAA